MWSPIKRHRTKLIAVVLAGDRQNRQREFLELIDGRDHRVVVSVGSRMLQDSLKANGWISDE